MLKILQYSFTEWAKMVIGAVIGALAFQYFSFPNDIVAGGVTGVAQIITLLTRIPVGVLILVMNIPLFVVGWKRLGAKSIVSSLLLMILNSVMIDVFAATNVVATDEPLLAAVYGGVLSGVGFGLVYSVGTTCGGTDILVKLLRRPFPYINFGTLQLLINAVVVLTFAVVFQKYDSCMYTMIQMFIMSQVVNLVLYGPSVAELCYIITDEDEKVKEAITTTLKRGVTFLRGEGAWSHREKHVILCVVKRQEAAKLRTLVRSVDENAFFILTEAKDVYGKGFGNLFGED